MSSHTTELLDMALQFGMLPKSNAWHASTRCHRGPERNLCRAGASHHNASDDVHDVEAVNTESLASATVGLVDTDDSFTKSSAPDGFRQNP